MQWKVRQTHRKAESCNTENIWMVFLKYRRFFVISGIHAPTEKKLLNYKILKGNYMQNSMLGNFMFSFAFYEILNYLNTIRIYLSHYIYSLSHNDCEHHFFMIFQILLYGTYDHFFFTVRSPCQTAWPVPKSPWYFHYLIKYRWWNFSIHSL